MKRRDFLANCAAAMVVPAIPLLKPEAKQPPKVEKKPLEWIDTPPTNRVRRYQEYDEMLKDPEVYKLMNDICSAAAKPRYESAYASGFCFRERRKFGNAPMDWMRLTPYLSDYWVYHTDGQRKSPFVIAMKPQDDEQMCLYGYDDLVVFYYGTLQSHENLMPWAWKLAVYGDLFIEPIPHPASAVPWGYVNHQSKSERTMYRIETTKGELIEFQQSAQGPVMVGNPAGHPVRRFAPNEILHVRLPNLNKERLPFYDFDAKRQHKLCSGFYPYGVSLLEYWRSGQDGKFGKFDLKHDAEWLVNVLRNNLLEGLTDLGQRHFQLRETHSDFILI